MVLDPGEERRVLEQRDLDRLRDAGQPVAVGQREQQVEVVEHRVRRRERADEVLLAERVDPVLDADAGVVLRQDRRRDADQPDAAVGGGGGVADRVEHRAAADRHHVRMAVDAVDVDRRADLVDRPAVVLDRLAAGDDERGGGQLERVVVSGAVELDVVHERRVRGGHAVVDDDEQARAAVGLHHVAQRRVARVEETLREAHRILEPDHDLLVDPCEREVSHACPHPLEQSRSHLPFWRAVGRTLLHGDRKSRQPVQAGRGRRLSILGARYAEDEVALGREEALQEDRDGQAPGSPRLLEPHSREEVAEA